MERISEEVDPVSEEITCLQENVSELAERILNLESNTQFMQHVQLSIAAKENLKKDITESILSTVQDMIQSRMEPMEEKIDSLELQCQLLEEKLQWLCGHLDEWGLTTGPPSSTTVAIRRGSPSATYETPAIPIPYSKFKRLWTSGCVLNGAGGEEPIAGNVEHGPEDYPNGVWLGDPTNPDLRVGVPISPEDLEEVNATCLDMADMALTLLDHLFDRETQACSNLSGKGKHKKKQLDPNKIEAIRCHLIYKFEISEQDWNEVKIKLDSKCKTAFQRKKDGLPLTTVKAFKKRSPRIPRKQLEEQPPNQDLLTFDDDPDPDQ